ncbi:MAG: hypothetical protein WCT16_00340 [Candidatus Buchananbacteria bacterium]
MPQDYLNKLKSLPPTVKNKLSTDAILSKLDALDEEFGIKSTSLVISILLGEVTTGVLADKLKTDYGFNDYLAHQVANGVREVVNEVGYYGRPAGMAALPAKESRKPILDALNKPQNSTVMTFSREDEEEIEKYIESVKTTPRITDYTDAATSIILSFGYPVSDEVMIKRLGSIIIARLKDIRDELETKENLMKSRKVGGMEFPEADADRILKIIKSVVAGQAAPADAGAVSKELQEILAANEEADTITPPVEKQQPRISPAPPTIEMEDGLPVIRMPDDLMIRPRDESAVLEKKLGLTPSFEQGRKKPQLPTAAQDVKIKTAKDLPLPQPQPFAARETFTGNLAMPRSTGRPNLDDVKFNKKLMGPIEELESMTLIDFRRLSPDPVAVTAKIKEKIDLLEQEHFGKKIDGIAAWHKNEVSKFYRLLGQTAMAEGKSIETVIKERLTDGKPTLSLDEFHAVMGLNRNLRY